MPAEFAYRCAEHHVDDVLQRHRPDSSAVTCCSVSRRPAEISASSRAARSASAAGARSASPARRCVTSVHTPTIRTGAPVLSCTTVPRVSIHRSAPSGDRSGTSPISGAVLGSSPIAASAAGDLREDVALEYLEGPRECPGLAHGLFQRGRPDDLPGRQVPFQVPIAPASSARERFRGWAKSHLGCAAVDRPGDEFGDRGCRGPRPGKGVRGVVVEHELAEQAAGVNQGDEREGRDAFGMNTGRSAASSGSSGTSGTSIGSDPSRRETRDDALDGHPVLLGQAAPRSEPDHALAVEHQDGRSLDADGLLQRGERSVIEPSTDSASPAISQRSWTARTARAHAG